MYIVVEEYQKLKEVRKTEKAQADTAKNDIVRARALELEVVLRTFLYLFCFVIESCSLRRHLPRGNSCSLLHPALETYIAIFLLDYIKAEINKKRLQGRGTREIREKSKMTSAWLFFKCLMGMCSSFSKAENRNLKDTAN